MGRVDPTRPVTLDDDVRAQFAKLGLDTAKLPLPAPEADRIDVWAPNWSAFNLFLACETQWRAVGTMGRPIWIGLDYAAVEIVQRRRQLEDVDWRDLQAMEGAALAILNSGDGS